MVFLQAALAAMAFSGVGQTVLLEFTGDRCIRCREMVPVVQSLVDAGYSVRQINVEQDRALTAQFRVRELPCFVMIADGREVDRQEGATSQARLVQMYRTGLAAQQPAAPVPAAAPTAVVPAVATEPWPPATATPPATADAALAAASVRLRIETASSRPDGAGTTIDCGSGTIIDRRGDEALVLTCGHIFRDSNGKGRITVDWFGAGEPHHLDGRLVSYDLTHDVGLVAICTSDPVGVVRVAPLGYRITEGMAVTSVGCNNGDPPTVRRSKITRLNRYVGPASIHVGDRPVEGRSGGGLFSGDGYVIGVCNAADPNYDEGFFAALSLIHAELDRDRFEFVYKSPGGSPGTATPGPAAPATATDLAALPAAPMGAMGPAARIIPAVATEPASALPAHEQAALNEIQRRVDEGSEVICIVRPRGNPEAKSDVIVLDHASQEFLKRLATVGQRQAAPASPPPDLPRPRRILMEWSSPASPGRS
jgi:thiol-disulfide isomerase/thioredoxin